MAPPPRTISAGKTPSLASALAGLFLLAGSCLLSLPAQAQAIPTGVGYSLKIHNAPNNKNWTGILTFNTVGGSVTGQLEWPSERSVHRIEGSYNNGVLSFREVSAIKPGKAHLNCAYTLKYQAASRTFSGSWHEEGKEQNYNGSASFSLVGSETTAAPPATKTTPSAKAAPASQTTPAAKPSSASSTAADTLPLSTGVGYGMIVKDNKTSKEYAATITFTSAKGSAAGRIEWITLGSIHRFEGSYDNGALTFRETSAIKSGKARLNCSYSLKYFPNDQRFEGPWTDPGRPEHAAGIAIIKLPRSGSGSVTSKVDDLSGNPFLTVHASIVDVTGTAISSPGEFKVPSGKTATSFQVTQLTGGVDNNSRGWAIMKGTKTMYRYSQYPSSSGQGQESESPPLATLRLEPGTYRVNVSGTRGAAVTVRYQLR